MERFKKTGSLKKWKPLALFVLALGFSLTSWSQVAVPEAKAGVFIHNCEELQAMKNNLTEDYCLANDIDCSMTNPADPGWNSAGTWGDGNGFDPVEDHSNPFRGSFSGNGYKIMSLYIDRSSTNFIGLFSDLAAGSKVKDVGLVNVKIIGGSDVGSLAGNATSAIITNSYATGNVSGCSVVGGLIGSSSNGTKISNSHFIGNVIGTCGDWAWDIGGLVGMNAHVGSEISNSYSSGSVSGRARVGGLVGSKGGLISRSYSTSNVSGSDAGLGGLVGELGSGGDGIIINSYATGNVNGGVRVGGLVGELRHSGTITNSYSTGHISGTWSRGGLVGVCFGGAPVVANSYWDTITSGQAASAGGTGKTTAQMKKEATFQPEWDFVGDPDPDNIWGITENVTYPLLQWPPVSVETEDCGVDTIPPVFNALEAWDENDVLINDGGVVADYLTDKVTIHSDFDDGSGSGIFDHKIHYTDDNWATTKTHNCGATGICSVDICGTLSCPLPAGTEIKYKSEATDNALNPTTYSPEKSFTVIDISVTISSSSDPTVGEDVDLTAVVTGSATGNIDYVFDCGDGSPVQTISGSANLTESVVCNYAAANTYTARVEVTRQGITASDTVGITVNPPNTPPTALINCNPASCQAYVCNSTSIDSCGLELQNASTDDPDCPTGVPCTGLGFKSCFLDINSGAITFSNCSDFPLTFSLSAGTYINGANLTVTDQGDLSDSDQKTITFKKDAYADFECSINGGAWESCGALSSNPIIGDTVGFRAVDAGNLSTPSQAAVLTTFDWDFGDGVGTASVDPTSYIYTSDNIYTVTLTVTDSAGRRARRSYTVTVGAATVSIPKNWTEISAGEE